MIIKMSIKLFMLLNGIEGDITPSFLAKVEDPWDLLDILDYQYQNSYDRVPDRNLEETFQWISRHYDELNEMNNRDGDNPSATKWAYSKEDFEQNEEYDYIELEIKGKTYFVEITNELDNFKTIIKKAQSLLERILCWDNKNLKKTQIYTLDECNEILKEILEEDNK